MYKAGQDEQAEQAGVPEEPHGEDDPEGRWRAWALELYEDNACLCVCLIFKWVGLALWVVCEAVCVCVC